MEDNLATQPEGEQPEEQEVYVEMTRREDYIASAYYSISAIEG